MTGTSFALQPISDADAARLRLEGGTIHVADEHPGYPCRQCLHDAEIGEELMLVSHDPFVGDSPYRSASPIFLHREACSSEHRPDALPTQLTRRQLSVRSFDVDELMIDAVVIDGVDLGDTIAKLFTDASSDHLHIHNAGRGCWAVRADRRHDG